MDQNSKHYAWGSRQISPRGKTLYQIIEEKKYTILSPTEPTHWLTDIRKLPDFLDFLIAKGIQRQYVDIKISPDCDGNHSPVIAAISSTVVEKEKHLTLTNKKTDWRSFEEWLQINFDTQQKLKTEDDIDEATHYLTSMIQKAAWLSTPEQINMEKSKGIQLDVLLLIKEKRRLRRVWMKSRNPLDKTALNKASKKLKEKLCENKNKAVQQYLENLSANKQDDYTLWKATKYFRHVPKVNQPIRNEEGHWAKNNKEKAKLFVVIK